MIYVANRSAASDRRSRPYCWAVADDDGKVYAMRHELRHAVSEASRLMSAGKRVHLIPLEQDV